jgi:hypothetical protein
MTRRADGRFGFVVVELAVEITTEEGFEENARRAARAAESGCLIAQALRVPVEVELTVRAAAPTTVRQPSPPQACRPDGRHARRCSVGSARQKPHGV